MARRPVIPPEGFNEVLAWFNPDRELAGAMYVQLRNDLFKLFNWAGCSDPEGLTDEAFDRVARKVHDVAPGYDGNPKHYFVAVARNLIKEDLKKVKKQVSLEDIEPAARETVPPEQEPADTRRECLRSCLAVLSVEKRKLIMNYYAKEKQAKIDDRARLARQLGMTLDALRVSVHRIRRTLEKCIEECLDQKDGQQ